MLTTQKSIKKLLVKIDCVAAHSSCAATLHKPLSLDILNHYSQAPFILKIHRGLGFADILNGDGSKKRHLLLQMSLSLNFCWIALVGGQATLRRQRRLTFLFFLFLFGNTFLKSKQFCPFFSNIVCP